MQAAKLKIGSSYAVKVDGDLYSLLVQKIITIKTGQHASDHEYRISGFLANPPEGYTNDRQFRLDQILGPYEEYAELVERKRAEEEARQAKDKADRDAATHLATLLCKIAGVKQEDINPKRHYSRDAIRASYHGVDIAKDGVRPLTEALERLVAKPNLKVV